MTHKKTTAVVLTLLLLIQASMSCASFAPREKANMPIVLLTDFGSEDYRIGQLKGIIYSTNPSASVVDASHSVPAFDIATGAFMLSICAREFPGSVVFIAIIAPYTQPEARYLVLQNTRDQYFVLPDNGLLTHVIRESPLKAAYRVMNRGLFDSPLRDLAAERVQGTLGALIASGQNPQAVGPEARDFTTLEVQEPAVAGSSLLGTIVYIDHFGNAITNIRGKTAAEFGLKPGDTVRIRGLGDEAEAVFDTNYSDVARGEKVVFVINNLDAVQLSINLGNFAGTCGARAGMKVEITR